MVARPVRNERTIVLPCGRAIHFARRNHEVLAICGPLDIWGVISHQKTRWYSPRRGMVRVKTSHFGGRRIGR
jgi:hypothetical protein